MSQNATFKKTRMIQVHGSTNQTGILDEFKRKKK